MMFSSRRATRAAVWFLAVSAGFFTPLRAAENAAPRPWTDYRTIMRIGDTADKKPEDCA